MSLTIKYSGSPRHLTNNRNKIDPAFNTSAFLKAQGALLPIKCVIYYANTQRCCYLVISFSGHVIVEH